MFYELGGSKEKLRLGISVMRVLSWSWRAVEGKEEEEEGYKLSGEPLTARDHGRRADIWKDREDTPLLGG